MTITKLTVLWAASIVIILSIFSISLYMFITGIEIGCMAGITNDYKYHTSIKQFAEDVEYCHNLHKNILK